MPPSYRKVNPADAPVLFIALTSPSMSLSELNDYAENLISPTLSTLDGVAQVNVYGQKRFAVRVRVQPDALAARNITLDELANALRAANANTPVGTLDGPRQTLTHPGQPAAAQRGRVRRADRQPAQRRQHGAPATTWPTVEDSFETVKTASCVQRRALDRAGDPAPARRQHGRRWSMRSRARAAAASRRSCRSRSQLSMRQRPLGLDPRRDPRREAHAARSPSCWWCW